MEPDRERRSTADFLIIGACVGALLGLIAGAQIGIGIERKGSQQLSGRVAPRVEMATYKACDAEFNAKYISEAVNFERMGKCNRVARAARIAIDEKISKR